YWYLYHYDSTGVGAGFSRHNPDGSTDLYFRERFTSDGRILKRVKDYPDSGKNEIRFTYDDNGLPSKEIHLTVGQEEAVYWFVFERF
ncbi:MAG: hypothetical protein AAF570_24615, partial [Bacteroidota bacterium]